MLQAMRGAILLTLAVLLAVAPGAAAQSPVEPWDGANPFECVLQQLGTGTDYPFPDADPFCVEFDKTNQNVTEAGIVQFLSLEPARVAAASPKCFYFQRDHWRASLLPNQPPYLYEWDGSYFFDKARGRGGVYVENFRVAGQTGDPTTVPGFPEEWKPHFSEGRGGIQSADSVQADPSCATRPNPSGPGGGGAPGGEPAASEDCRVPGGRIRRGIGGINLGARRARVGKASRTKGRYLVWCVDGGGRIVARLGKGARVRLVLTDSRPYDTRRIRVGRRAGAARKSMRREKRLGKVAGSRVFLARERRRSLYVGIASGRITWIAVAGRKLSRRGARRYLRGAVGA
jgi:hypothetical protein